eukprot:TCONS_00020661-protein
MFKAISIFLALFAGLLLPSVNTRAMQTNKKLLLDSIGRRYFHDNQNKDGSMVMDEKRNASLQHPPTSSLKEITSFCFVRIKYVCKNVCRFHICKKLCVPYKVLDCIAIKGNK